MSRISVVSFESLFFEFFKCYISLENDITKFISDSVGEISQEHKLLLHNLFLIHYDKKIVNVQAGVVSEIKQASLNAETNYSKVLKSELISLNAKLKTFEKFLNDVHNNDKNVYLFFREDVTLANNIVSPITQVLLDTIDLRNKLAHRSIVNASSKELKIKTNYVFDKKSIEEVLDFNDEEYQENDLYSSIVNYLFFTIYAKKTLTKYWANEL